MNENIRLEDNIYFDPRTGQFVFLPNIVSFVTSKDVLTDETPAVVSWHVTGATVVKLNDDVVASAGSREYHVTDLFTVTLTASNDTGTTPPVALTIDIDRQPPLIHFFKPEKPVGYKGAHVTLAWDVKGARTIEIDNGVGDVSGIASKTFTLGSNGVFQLTASNYFGFSSKAIAAITIFPLPLIESLLVPAPDFNFRLTLKNISISKPEINTSIRFDKSEMIGLSTPFIKLANQIPSNNQQYKWNTSLGIAGIFNKIKKIIK